MQPDPKAPARSTRQGNLPHFEPAFGHECLEFVEQSHLPAKRTLDRLGISRRTFYRWYDRYLDGGPEALEDRPSAPSGVCANPPKPTFSDSVRLIAYQKFRGALAAGPFNEGGHPLLPYLVLFLIFASGALTVASRPPREQRPALLIGGFIIVMMVGLRFHVGCDWDTYLHIYQRGASVIGFKLIQGLDPGYSLLNWVIAQLGLGIAGVNVVCALIFAFGLVSFSRAQPNPPLALVVSIPYLVTVVAMGYTRQSAALGFILLALLFRQKSLILTAILLVLAAAFHRSAILVFPFFVLEVSGSKILTSLMFGILAFIVYRLFVQSNLDTLMANYIESGYSSSGALLRVLMNVLPAILFLLSRQRFSYDPRERKLWTYFSLTSLGALVGLLLSPSSTAVDRSALYLIPLQVFTLSRVPSAFGTRERHNMLLTLAVIIYSFVIEIVWLNFGQFSRCWIPYRSYLWG